MEEKAKRTKRERKICPVCGRNIALYFFEALNGLGFAFHGHKLKKPADSTCPRSGTKP